jgi:CheY-like chemotaxis protein
MDCGMKILIVDDQPENLLLLTKILERPGLVIVKARSGEEALKSVEGLDLALAILDIQMPGMNGFELAEALHASEPAAKTPIIFLTALSAQDRFICKGYEAGAVDYLFKPVEPQIIRSKVAVFLELHRQRRLIEEQSKLLEEKVRSLQEALEQIKTLKGIIPICSHCKKIRSDSGAWEQIERYIEKHSDAGFSHGICPDCLKTHFPELADDILGKQEKDQ